MRIDQAFAALRFAPVVPAWLLAELAALCVAALVPAIVRRARGAWWRGACFAVLLAWLAGPRLVHETREALSDVALLLVDETESMQVGNRAALRDAARANIEAQAAKLPGLELRTVVVPQASGHPGEAGGTRLFDVMDHALADIPRGRLAGVLALTDGQVHDSPAAPLSAPFHLLVPAKGEETDRRLRIVEAPSYGIVGRSVTLKVAIEDLGVIRPDASAHLTLRRDGEPAQTVTVPVGPPQPIDIPITRAGPTIVELTAEPLPGEVSDLNNHAVIEINGVRDRLRVLLVSGEPHAGERTWRRLLKADPAVDLVHFTILRPPDKDDMTPLNELALIAFPIRELFQVKIKDFDLIILDRFQNRNILPAAYLRNIADYVRTGGALLMSVGPEFAGPASLAYTPLGGVMPAHPTGLGGVVDAPFRPLVTALGERHPVTAGLPGDRPGAAPSWGPWYRRVDVADAHGEAVMSGPDGQPLLLLDHVGEGRAAMLLSDQIWLWSRDEEGGGPQAELLRRVAHWLMKEPSLEEEALTARIDDGSLHVERRTGLDGATPDIAVTAPDGMAGRLALRQSGPGRAVGEMPASTPGVWQVSDGTRTAFAAAGTANPLEFADLRATAERLAPVVRASGGGTTWLAPSGAPELRQVEPGRAAAGAGWAGLRRNHDHVVTGLDSQPLLPPWLALPLLLGLALAAWRREGAS
jgi:hypothetical protein